MKLFISSILIVLCSCGQLYAQEIRDSVAVLDSVKVIDSTQVVKEEKEKVKHFQYARIGLDVSKLVRSSLTDDYNTMEFMLESIWKPKMHYVAEVGFASSNNTGVNLSFQSTSYFVKVGFDKYFFGKLYKEDLDNAFVGLRFASAIYNRQEATVQLWDPFYGNTTINKAANTNLLYWIELNAGLRVELTRNIFIGWNLRGKTFLNPNKIKELTPTYLAGYGAAKKQPGIDYNFYLLYGFGKR